MLKLTQISERFWKGRQSWNYQRVVRAGDKRLRITIKRDAYDFQSHLYGDAYDSVHMKWHRLVARPLDGATCADTSYVDRNPNIQPFREDAEDVLVELLEIIE